MCEYSETSEDNDWVSERRGKHRGGVNPGSSHGQLSKDLHQRNAWQSTKTNNLQNRRKQLINKPMIFAVGDQLWNRFKCWGGGGGGQWFPFNDSNSRTSMLLDQGIESFLFHTCAWVGLNLIGGLPSFKKFNVVFLDNFTTQWAVSEIPLDCPP